MTPREPVDPAVTAPAPAPALRRAVGGSLVGKAVEVATLVMLATVVPRLMGPADYGRFAVPLAIVTIGSLALTLGGPAVMARFVPAAPPAERVALARALGWRLARGRALQLALMAAVVAVAAAIRPQALPVSTTTMVGLALALNVAASLACQVALGLGRTGVWSARFPLQNTVLVASALLLHGRYGVDGAIGALVISGAVAAGFGLWALAPVLGHRGPTVALPPGALRFGTVHATAAGLTQVTQRGGILAVALAGSAVQSGYASLAIGVALGVTYAIVQTFTVTLPHLGADHASGEEVGRRLGLGLLAVLLPGTVAVAALLPAIVPAMFGEEYRGALGAFGPALAMVVMAPLHSVAVQAAILRLRPAANLAGAVAGALAFVVVALLAVPRWGATGGTLAGAAAAAVGGATTLGLLPGAAGRLLPAASVVGVAAVLCTTLAVR